MISWIEKGHANDAETSICNKTQNSMSARQKFWRLRAESSDLKIFVEALDGTMIVMDPVSISAA